ncbi:MAG: polyprenol monophosphomannose synthase [Actinomycetes bacterium]
MVVVPTYNEIANISDVILRLKSATADVDILIVDDNSPDGTGALADSLVDSRTHVLHRSEKGGLGPAYLAGFTWGHERGYEYFVEMDADGSHQPEEIARLLTAATGHDLVLGTRWMPGGSVINWPISRRLISRFGTRYASLALGLPYRDLTSGYRLLSRRLIEDIFTSQLTTIGYGFQIEIVRIASAHQRSIIEVPITFVERVAGSSKMSRKIVIEAWRKTTIWGLQRMVNRR